MKRLVCILITLSICVAPMSSPRAEDDGKLDRVESETDSASSSDSDNTSTSRSSSNNLGEDLAVSFVGGFFEAILYHLFAGLYSQHIFERGMSWKEGHAFLKREQLQALPTFRLEAAYHKLASNNVHAYNINALAGYILFATEFDMVHYFERSPTDQLKIMSPRLMFRGSPSRIFELDLTLGAKILRGRRTQAGFEFGLPMAFFIGKHLSIDVKNYYAVVNNTKVFDFALGVSAKWKMLGGRVAYRSMKVGDEQLHGPTAGLFFQW
jgi:hypothetical protein